MFLGLAASTAKGVVTVNSVSGISRQETSTATGSTTGTLIYFAGMAGSGGDLNPDGTYNTCRAAGSTFQACNEASVQPSTLFTITYTYTAVVTTPNVVVKKNAESGNSTGSFQTPVVNGNQITLSILWSDLCNLLNSTGSGGCTGAFTQTLQFGVGKDQNTLDDKIDIKFVVNTGTTGVTNSSYCNPEPAGTYPARSGDGFCYVKMERGDEKVYVTNMTAPSGFPSAGGGGADNRYVDAVFYYASGTDGEAAATILARVSPQSSPKSLSLASTTGTSLSQDRIEGLTNGEKYCFIMASRDATGNISSFTDPAEYAAAGDSESLCAVPAPVAGLLDDKSCFIATAAWGSELDSHVDDLRRFRDRFLISTESGRAFVRAYYRWSPPLAGFIAESEVLRTAARAVLWPVLTFARLSLWLGIGPALLLAFSVPGLIVFGWRRRRGGRS